MQAFRFLFFLFFAISQKNPSEDYVSEQKKSLTQEKKMQALRKMQTHPPAPSKKVVKEKDPYLESLKGKYGPPPPGPHPGAGRPCKYVDVELLKRLAAIHCTMQEMSDLVGVSVDTLEHKYSETIKEAQSHGKMSLRRLQARLAEDGNAAMAIWLGKVYLKQREEPVAIAQDQQINLIINKYFDKDLQESTPTLEAKEQKKLN